ncbi:MAG: hypothetical protein L6Q95_13495 [Planctomycetes bacterium]|nr:hypothetical protein [Planctomycetota bacterium]
MRSRCDRVPWLMSFVVVLWASGASRGEVPRPVVEAYLAETTPQSLVRGDAFDRLLAAADEQRWTFTAAIYLWATGVDGDVGAGGVTASVDVPFSELFDDLTGAFMGRFGARKGRWGVMADVFWCSLEDRRAGPLGGTITAEMDLFLCDLTGSYRAVETGDAEKGRFTLDACAGARLYSTETRITTALTSVEQDETWVDPIVGFDARFRTHRWTFGVRADIGGFGISSDLCWSAMAGVAFECTKVVSVAAGYRWLDVDFESGGSPVLDAQLSGPFLALVFAW